MAAKGKVKMLCLIHCGGTSWSDAGRVQGASDLPLSDAGRAAVEAELHRLMPANPAVVYHPADEAAAQTAGLCATPLKAKTRAVDELGDPHLGLLEGLTEQEFAERFPRRFKQWQEDPLSVSPPEGEEIAHAADRLLQAVAKIMRRSRSGEVAIVLHDIGVGMLRAWLADRSLNEWSALLPGRPRIERYAMPIELVSSLESAADSQHATS